MILFAGSQERGFFAQETAAIKEMELEYLQGSLTIKNHLNDILSRQCEYLIFDIEQYVDSAREVAEEIKRIEVAKNCQVIIYAPGYDRQSKIIRELQNQGILYYIFAVSQTEAREELERCLYGYYKEPEYQIPYRQYVAQSPVKPVSTDLCPKDLCWPNQSRTSVSYQIDVASASGCVSGYWHVPVTTVHERVS